MLILELNDIFRTSNSSSRPSAYHPFFLVLLKELVAMNLRNFCKALKPRGASEYVYLKHISSKPVILHLVKSIVRMSSLVNFDRFLLLML